MVKAERYIDKNNLYIVFLLTTITIVFYRFLLPYADEPDYFFRIRDILNNQSESIFHYILNVYYGDSIRFDTVQECDIKGGVSSLYFSIDNYFCRESNSLIIKRTILSVVIIIPFFLLSLGLKIGNELTNNDFVYRARVICLSLLFPSMIYYLGVIAVEQLTLLYSLLLYLFWKNKILRYIIPVLIYPVESGTTIVLLGFVLLFSFFNHFFNRNHKSTLAGEFFCLSICLVCLIFGMSLLELLYVIPGVSEKAQLIYLSYTEGSFAFAVDKYPVILRPIITFMTGTFMLPSGIKFFPIYIILFIPVIFIFVRRFNNVSTLSALEVEAYLKIVVIISFICCFVFVLPGFSNAKYYVFLLPFIVDSILVFYSVRKYIGTILFCNFSIIFFLMFINL